MPKSSNAIPKPSARMDARVCWVWMSSARRIDSVSSNSMRSGGTPDVSSSSCSSARKPGTLSCTGDRLIETFSRAQRQLSSNARRITCMPSASINPHSSANGMKKLGGTAPRIGCVQRASASTPIIAPFSNCGW